MKIFISYARENTEEALAIQQALSIHDVWRDHKLSVGQVSCRRMRNCVGFRNIHAFLYSRFQPQSFSIIDHSGSKGICTNQ